MLLHNHGSIFFDQIGYQGWIGCEFKPLKNTAAGLH